MILFCCASELGPPEDLSAIEVILYYYYYYYCLDYYRMQATKGNVRDEIRYQSKKWYKLSIATLSRPLIILFV